MAKRGNGKGVKAVADALDRKNAADDFDQGGPDGPARLKRLNGPDDDQGDEGEGDETGIGHNSKLSQEKIQALNEGVETILTNQREIDIKREDFAKKLAAATEKNKQAITKAKKSLGEDGFNMKAVNAVVRLERLHDKIDAIETNMDPDQVEDFRTCRDALAGHDDLPLAKAAIEREERDQRQPAH